VSARSHPPSLLRHAERLIRDERLFGRGDVVLCACSGGPDSGALLHVLALLRERLGHAVVAHGVDHGLREGAAAELDVARAVAEPLGVPFTVTRVALEPGANLQARARAVRYEALAGAAAAAGARVIATGHTADDRAETVLLRLLRGAGPRGLAVLPPRAPLPVSSPAELVRPLLRARRGDVLAHLERHRLPFAQDPSNLDPRFTRVRVRREVLPLLEELSPTIVTHLCALADMLAPAPGAGPLDAPLGGLNRAQRLAVERARRLGRPGVLLALPGGRQVEVTFPDGRIVLNEAQHPPHATPPAPAPPLVEPPSWAGRS
jgi:tRNA(Ile)-lysidine synthase